MNDLQRDVLRLVLYAALALLIYWLGIQMGARKAHALGHVSAAARIHR
jgi:hypothetical protein